MKQRLTWLDTAKGLGIILVLLGHAPREIMREQYVGIDFLYYFIYTFHMHFFFFLAGYAAALSDERHQDRTPAAFFKRRARGLLIPWAVYSVLIYLLIFLLNMVPPLREMTEGTFLTLVTPGEYLIQCVSGSNPYCTHLWYVYTLFLTQILVFFCKKVYHKIYGGRKEGLGFYIGLEAAAAVGYLILPLRLPVAVSMKGYLLYYLLGMICFLWEKKQPVKKKKRTYVFCLAGPLICILNVLLIDMGMCQDPQIRKLISFSAVFVGAPLMIFILVSAARRAAGKIRVLLWLGKHSFTIYLLHQPFGCAVLGTVLLMILPDTLPCCLLIMCACIGASIAFPVTTVKAGKRMGLTKPVDILTGGRERGK